MINGSYNFVLNNKIVCNQLLQQYIKTPTIWLMKSKVIISSFNNIKNSYEDIYELLKTEKKLFIKPINAGKGEGVHLFNYQNDNIYIDNNKISKENFSVS